MHITESSMIGMAFVVYLAAALAYMISALSRKQFVHYAAIGTTCLGLIAHSAALTIRIREAGRAPFTNTYETLVFFAWLLVIFSLHVELRYKIKVLGAFTMPLASITLAATSLLNADIEPLMPSLKSNWLLWHVLTCFIAYAAFAIAFSTSALYLLYKAFARVRHSEEGHSKGTFDFLDALTYRMITLGFPLLTLGIVTGSIWAEVCWGTYWSWDPKETWSLVTWLIYGICLHLRYTANWHGSWGALSSVIGFISVLFTYFGVNYLLAGLHAYA